MIKTARIDVPTLALGALGGATLASAAFIVPLAAATSFLPAAALAAAGVAVHLGGPARKARPTARAADPLSPAKTPLAWMEECGAMGPDVDRQMAARIVRARLESGFRAQPRQDAPHVAVLNHMLDLARGRGTAEGERAYAAFVAKANASIVGTPLAARAAVEGLASELPRMAPHPVHRRHGTVTTRLMARLADAHRTFGNLPTSEFLWLKSIDRPLWYALNNLGRLKFHVEGAAAISHYQSEMSLGRPLDEPHVDEAAEGIMEFWDAAREREAVPA